MNLNRIHDRIEVSAPGLAPFETWDPSPSFGGAECFLTSVCHSEFFNACHSEQSEESAVVGKPRICSRTVALRSGFGWHSAFSVAINADRMNEGH
jgi:hypothetical protein